MNYLTIEHLTKYFGEKLLFRNVSLYINKGDKIALIARNGAGKSTLLKVLAGEESVEGEHRKIEFHPDIRIGYLHQNPELDVHKSIIEEVLSSKNEAIQALKKFKLASQEGNSDEDMQTALSLMEKHKAWDLEAEVESILSRLGIVDLQQKVGQLSGGQKKRVALAKILIDEPDFLILDEPTNHLDIQMIEWLEDYLSRSSLTIFLITHDRYFLENVCDRIIELEDGSLYNYKGSYSDYLEKKEEKDQNEAVRGRKNVQLYKKELDWMRRQPKARTTKAKSREDDFESLEDTVRNTKKEEDLEINVKPARLGAKILEFHNVSFSFENKQIVKNWTYKFKRFEKVGIVGPNGSGKSTLARLMTGSLDPEGGKIKRGETVHFGYYEQEGMSFKMDERVIDAIRKVADYIPLEKGRQLSAEQMLEKFLFPRPQHRVLIRKLSGGEKRRLYLLRVLMKNPNFLILDEPTNDLDIITLNVLEEYLKSFPGCVVVISHDRFFMDKIVDHVLVLQEDGSIRDFPGNYSQLREREKTEKREVDEISAAKPSPKKQPETDLENPGLSYEERKLLRKWEQQIEKLQKDKEQLGTEFQSADLSVDRMKELSAQIKKVDQQVEDLEEKWLELVDKS